MNNGLKRMVKRKSLGWLVTWGLAVMALGELG